VTASLQISKHYDFSVSGHQNKQNNPMLTSSVRLPPAGHADRSVPKKQLSHTADNSYHPDVSHVGFP